MNPDQLRDILAAHKRWLNGEADGVRANLNGAYLIGANLRGSDLRGSDLRGSDLRGSDLRGSDLRGSDLRGSDLRGANLRGAYLRDANLRGAYLIGANLRGANLNGANLRDAYLRGANLNGAYLRDANLRGSDLAYARGLRIADDAPQRLKAVAQAALASNDALEMDCWHTCDTTHSIAGWAIHQAGALGRLLEQVHGPEIAGLMLLGTEAHRYLHAGNDEAREFLRSVLND